MDKDRIIEKLTEFFSRQEKVIFAVIFGSFLKGERFRDIDIAVLLEEGYDLLTVGALHARSEMIVGIKTDIVIANGLYEKDPAFAREVTCTGELIFTRSNETYIDYKEKSLLWYFDTEYLRKQTEQAFDKRLRNGMAGKRNFRFND